MASVSQLQSYLRQVASYWHTPIMQPPFTLFLDSHKDSPYSNYAIPDAPVGGDLRAPLAALRATFAAHMRRPRLEFIEGFAPDLAASLRDAGFVEESRIQLMICTPQSYRPAPAVSGLTLTMIGPDSPLAEVRAMLDVQREGFESSAGEPFTDEDATHFLRSMRAGRSWLARLDGRPVAAGSFNTPVDGLAEVAGIATLEPFRRRGIAAAITAATTKTAFEQGVELVFLTAADERAGRVYERTGFQPYAAALAYHDPAGVRGWELRG